MSPLPHFKDSYSQKSKGIFSIEHVFKFNLSLRKTKMKLFLRMLSEVKKKISSEAILLKGKKQTIAVCCLHYCCHAGAHPILQSIDVLYIHYSTRNSIVRDIFLPGIHKKICTIHHLFKKNCTVLHRPHICMLSYPQTRREVIKHLQSILLQRKLLQLPGLMIGNCVYVDHSGI